MLPFTYAVRNLFRSKTRLLQTVGGSALVVLLVMAAMAINRGMMRVLSASGSLLPLGFSARHLRRSGRAAAGPACRG